MRDIKYRAYRKDTKSMHPVDELVWDENHNLRWVKIGDHLLDIKIIELMQSTGLKDKNGKEIYSGDIVRHYKLNDHNKSEPIIGEITISPLRGVVGGNWPLSFDNRVEVIGNIYESKPISDIITTDG